VASENKDNKPRRRQVPLLYRYVLCASVATNLNEYSIACR